MDFLYCFRLREIIRAFVFTPEIIRPMLDMLDFTLATCLPRVNRQRLTLTLTLVCEQWKEGEAFTPILQGNSIY